MRGERGKLPRTWISLSVKSMASWGCLRVRPLPHLLLAHLVLDHSKGRYDLHLQRPSSQSLECDALLKRKRTTARINLCALKLLWFSCSKGG